MITVEKALKDGKMHKAVNDENKKKNLRKKILIFGGVAVVAYLGYKYLFKNNEEVRSSNT